MKRQKFLVLFMLKSEKRKFLSQMGQYQEDTSVFHVSQHIKCIYL